MAEADQNQNAPSVSGTGRWPPKLMDDTHFESWKKDIEIWCKLTDIPAPKRALAIHLSLTGRARIASSEMEIAELEHDDGVKNLMIKLDGIFLSDKGRRQFASFNGLYNFRRLEEVSISDFVGEFEHKYYEFTRQGMQLPDPVMAFMLLASCNLSESETQLVMSAISDVTYDIMKSTIKRVFDRSVGRQNYSDHNSNIVKTEPVFFSNNGRNSRRGRGQSSRGGRLQSYQQPLAIGASRDGNVAPRLTGGNSQAMEGRGRKTNPIGRNGKITRCLICESTFHWAKDCPHSHENNDSVSGQSVGENEETVHLSLFLGYAGSNGGVIKLSKLVDESRGCAVLDTGCSTTVCGEMWLESYLQFLSDYEKDKIIENQSSSTFTFGDGTTVASLRKVTLPCWIGNVRANVTTDVVTCNIPLLLSKRSMKKAEMCLDFGNDRVLIGGKQIDLQCTSSGHYILPLNL